MFAGLFVAVAAFGASTDGIDLSDVDRFPISKEVAKFHEQLAASHAGIMRGEVCGWCTREVLEQWEFDCQRRWECWHRLRCAVDFEFARMYGYDECGDYDDARVREIQLQCLAELRVLIGPDAYYAGVMPDAIPQYRR